MYLLLLATKGLRERYCLILDKKFAPKRTIGSVVNNSTSFAVVKKMLQWKNTSHETYYVTLSVKEDATLEEIRSSYRSALLTCHPDKLQTSCESDRFLKVQQAWEILGNPKSRAAYDNELRASRHDLGVAEELSLEDMTIKDDALVLILSYQCRCGDYFSVDSSELGNVGFKVSREESELWLETPDGLPASVVIPCGSCSLQVRLLFITDIKVPIHDRS